MKKLGIYHVLLFTIGVFALLAPLVYFTPVEGWQIGSGHLKFMSYERFIHPLKAEKADVEHIADKTDTVIVEENILQYQHAGKGNLGAPKGGTINVNNATSFYINEKGTENLGVFFKYLEEVSDKKEKLSVLHFGDSQIEGDRMTNFLRQRLQMQFGGFGPGVIPATNVYNTSSFDQIYSDNFVRYTSFGREGLKSDKYGGIGSVSRFTPEVQPTKSELAKMAESTGWIEIEPSPRAYQRSKIYNNVVLHYTDCIAPVKLKVYKGEELIHDDYLLADSIYHALTFSFDETPGKLKFVFTGKVSPNICGFSLEGDYGVQVTNVGMRGSSGVYFWKMNFKDLRKMYEQLNAKLVILQFGGNSVPFFKDSSDVERFAKNFKGQINYVKKIIPDAAVVVIGPSDMSDLVEGVRMSYKFLPYCVERMRDASMEAGAAYWDLFNAMGGVNSMPSWVEKGWAAKDYIHFSNAGASYASQLFYDAFMAEYVKWKEKR